MVEPNLAGTVLSVVLVVATMLFSATASLGADGDEVSLEERTTETPPATPPAARSVDVLIDIRDSPPSYADRETDLPVSVVQSGQTVQWQWEGGLPHSVTTDTSLSMGDEAFDSGVQRLDQDGDPYTFEVTFTEPGVYKVFCQVHTGQHGEILVV